MSSKMSSSDGDSVKINKVHQIVRLRQMLQKWRKTASLASISPKLMRRLSSSTLSESKQYYNQTSGLISSEDEEELRETLTQTTCVKDMATSKAHRDETLNKQQLPPEGHLAVYVGKERRKFFIRTEHINHPLFRGLLEKTEQEFGINQVGGLAIACEVVFFEHLLWMVDNKHLDHIDPNGPELRELLDFYHMSNFNANSSAAVQEPNCNAQQLHSCISIASNPDNYSTSRPCW